MSLPGSIFETATIPHDSPIATNVVATCGVVFTAWAKLALTTLMVLPAVAAICTEALAQADAPEVVFLNLSEGGFNLLQGPADDAPGNRSAVATVAPYPAFTWRFSAEAVAMPADPSRQDVEAYLLHRLHRVFWPYNVLWTARRPAAGPYNMVLVGGSPSVLGLDRRVAGVAIMDCGNRMPSNVVFAFPEALHGNLHGLFVAIAQEAGHALGLEHTADEEDLMNPRLGPAQMRFTDRSNAVEPPRICGPLAQNSHQALLRLVGAWPEGKSKPLADGVVPDVTPPRLQIVSPAPGALLASPVLIEAQAEDESGTAEVHFGALGQLVRRESAGATSLRQSFELPPGAALLSVWVRDNAHNWAQASVEVFIESKPDAPGCAFASSTTHNVKGRIAAWAMVFAAIAALGTCRRARR